ncbi:MAG: serine/threonine protein kinase [Deltaproteobacteria bacterium]|nr:serine/threonine protein kinase [Deltaproteobacteria bacterium]
MAARPPTRIGRYLLFDELASGGMASVHLGRLEGPSGFARTVAIKRLFRSHAEDPGSATLFLDEARIASRINHPNVVPVIDVVSSEKEALLVMEYVHGASLSELLHAHEKRGTRAPVACVAQVMVNVLTGLHAAHDTCDDDGAPLGIIHRDVSPQNVMVSVDGIARVVDFGIARAERRLSPATKEGLLRGKLAYMPPEQIAEGGTIDRRSDVYAAALVMWEALTGRKLFDQEIAVVVAKKLSEDPPPPRSIVPEIPEALDAIVTKALSHHPSERYATALEMARAIEAVVPPVSPREIGEWVKDLAAPLLERQAALAERARREEGPPIDAAASVAPAFPLNASEAPKVSAYVTTKDLEVPTSALTPRRAAAAAVLLLLLVVVVLFVWVRRPAPLPASAASPAVASASAFASASASASAFASPSASASASAPASASPATPTLLSDPPSKPKPKPKPSKNCDPPWRVDDKGVRILKKECF